MFITSKKLLSSLASLSVVGLSVTSVVACGFNLDKIRNRTIKTDVLNTTFSYPVSSFNTAYTMQSEDHDVLAQTNATLVSIDEFGRLYGDIFKSNKDLSVNRVGTTSDFITWDYSVRENLWWKKWDGTKERKIAATDIYRTAYFALNTKVTSSAVGSLWRTFIKGATEVSEWLNSGSYSYDQFLAHIKSDEVEFGLECVDGADGGGTVKFTLTKAAPYFESLICYSAFSPIFDEKVDKVSDFKKGTYSGAYLPTVIKSNKMTLVKNDDYQFAEEVSIKTINYINTGGGGAQQSRILFEAGDISGFSVSSADSVGWNRYVGDDVDNPIFDQAYDIPSSRSASTFGFFFNPVNTKIGNATSGQYVDSSKLLQFADARAFIATSLNRSDFVRYYSSKYDGDNPVSAMLRNTYTSPLVGLDGATDYTQYVAAVADKENGVKSTKLAEGTDYLYGNSESIMGKTQAQLIASIKSYLDENDVDYSNKVKLEFLLNSDLNASINPYFKLMFDKFNAIEGNPIEIVTVDSTSAADYQDRAQKGQFDIHSSGWGPDYADPSTFLNTLTIGGDMSNYTGTVRFLDENNELKNDALRSTATDDYIKAYVDYTDTFNEIDVNPDDSTTQRFEKFAQLEYKMLYEDFLFMPLYKAVLPKNYIISHLIPYTGTYITTYGISSYKLFTRKLTEKLLTKDEVNKVFADYAANLEAVGKDESYKKADRVFWK